MRNVDFRDTIEKTLRRHSDGLTWTQLRERCWLLYGHSCPNWIKQLGRDIGLFRDKRLGRALVWKVKEH